MEASRLTQAAVTLDGGALESLSLVDDSSLEARNTELGSGVSLAQGAQGSVFGIHAPTGRIAALSGSSAEIAATTLQRVSADTGSSVTLTQGTRVSSVDLIQADATLDDTSVGVMTGILGERLRMTHADIDFVRLTGSEINESNIEIVNSEIGQSSDPEFFKIASFRAIDSTFPAGINLQPTPFLNNIDDPEVYLKGCEFRSPVGQVAFRMTATFSRSAVRIEDCEILGFGVVDLRPSPPFPTPGARDSSRIELVRSDITGSRFEAEVFDVRSGRFTGCQLVTSFGHAEISGGEFSASIVATRIESFIRFRVREASVNGVPLSLTPKTEAFIIPTEGQTIELTLADGSRVTASPFAPSSESVLSLSTIAPVRIIFDLGPCDAIDLVDDDILDLSDIQTFITSFVEGSSAADINADDRLDLQDVQDFLILFADGCAA